MCSTKALGRLQHQGHEILVFQISTRGIELPFKYSVLFKDIEAAKALRRAVAFRKAYQEAMESSSAKFGSAAGRRVDHVLLKTSDDLGYALSHYLHGRQRQGGTSMRGEWSPSTKRRNIKSWHGLPAHVFSNGENMGWYPCT